MKKFTKINYILTFILVFCIGAIHPHIDRQQPCETNNIPPNRKCLIVSPRPPFPHRSPLTEKQLTSAAMTAANGWTVR